MNRSKTLSLFFLCFTISLAGCSKNYPDPPKQITQDTCTEDYFNNHPDLAKALYEAEGSPQDPAPDAPTAGVVLLGHKITEVNVAAYNLAQIMNGNWRYKMLGQGQEVPPYQKAAFDYLNKHGPEKYKKYVTDCRKLAGLNNPFNTETKK